MVELLIRPLAADDLPALFEYLGELQAENGQHGTPLFDPRSRSAPAREPEREERFAKSLDVEIGDDAWRRAWVALDDSARPAGHVDLRGTGLPNAKHRCWLGLGVASGQRGRGLATRLVQRAIDWAKSETEIAWIDLEYLATNHAAERLYQRLGFVHVATVADMFRVDGESVTNVRMTLRIER